MTLERIQRVLAHPLTVGIGGFLALFGIAKSSLIFAIIATFWTQAGGLFGAASVTLFASQHIALPGWVVTVATVLGVAAFPIVAVKTISRFWRGVQERTK